MMIEPLLLALWIGLIGLVVGSYLNVLVYRIPRGKSTVLPRSRCPYCQGPIRARDNLPVLSFLLLRGRCRHCRAPISWRYPVIEGLTALLFLASFATFGFSPALAHALVFCCLMVLLVGCGKQLEVRPVVLTKTVIEKVTVPAELLEPCEEPELDSLRTTGDLERAAIRALAAAKCGNEDKAAIREWQSE